MDAGGVDAGVIDAGVIDAGSIDAGTLDAGSVDAGATDAGAMDAGMRAMCPPQPDGGADAGRVVDAGPGDVTPPSILEVTFTPPTVDTSAVPQTITIDLHAGDDLSGVAMSSATFRSPNGQQSVTGSFFGPPLTGSDLDGGWRTTAQVRAFSEQGTWLLTQVVVWDRVGNSRALDVAELADAGFMQTGAGDSVAPAVQTLSFTPSTIDTSASSRDVAITLVATDNLSGVSLIPFSFTSPSGTQLVTASMSRTSGTGLNGTWTGTATFPRLAESGTWTVNALTMLDAVSNRREYTRAELQTAGFNTSLVQTGAGDVAGPSVVALELAPATFSSSGGDVVVCFTMRITDDASGFSSGSIFAFSPGGATNLGGSFQANARSSGTELDGVYIATLRVPRFSVAGAWSLRLSLTDRSGRSSSIDAVALGTLGLPSEFTITP